MSALGGRQSLTTELVVFYSGVNISADIAKFVVGCSYVDNASGQVDDLTLTLRDDEQLWIGPWSPQKGDTIDVTIRIKHPGGRASAVPCGKFTVDELTASGPPRVFEIKAVSVPVDRSIRRQKKSRAWEAVTLFEIASDMANTGGLLLVYDAPAIQYDRRDQHDEADLAFLQRLCKDEALALKVTDERLVIFSEENAEHGPTVASYAPGTVISWRFNSQAHDVFNACTVAYTDPQTGETLEYTYRDPNHPSGDKVRKVTRRVSSLAEAENLAKRTLRNANKREVEGEITVMGNAHVYAGSNVSLTGFGVFSGKYSVETVSHDTSNGYTQRLTIHKVLEGY